MGAGVLAIIFSFFSYYTASARTAVFTITEAFWAWHGFFGWFAAVVALVAGAVLATAVLGQVHVPFHRQVTMGGFAIATVSVIVALLVLPGDVPHGAGVSNGRGAGYWLSLIVIVIGLVLSLIRLRDTSHITVRQNPGAVGRDPEIGDIFGEPEPAAGCSAGSAPGCLAESATRLTSPTGLGAVCAPGPSRLIRYGVAVCPFPVHGGTGHAYAMTKEAVMSGYPQPPAQPSSRARGGARFAETPKSVLLERVGAGLGVLMFVWGFLPWYGLPATDVNGYGFGSPAPVAIGLSLLASGVAAARMLDQKSASPLLPLAAAAVAALVSLGLIVDRGDNVSLNVGLILALVTTLLQTAAFALAWLHETGRLGVAARSARWSGSTPYGYGTQEAGNGPGSSAYPAPTGYVGQSGYAQSGYSATPITVRPR